MSTERTPEGVEAAVLAYIESEFNLDVSAIDRDTKLVRTGLIDSVSLVQLATWAERTFEIEVPDEDIDAEHLETVAMIAEYLLGRMAAA